MVIFSHFPNSNLFRLSVSDRRPLKRFTPPRKLGSDESGSDYTDDESGSDYTDDSDSSDYSDSDYSDSDSYT